MELLAFGDTAENSDAFSLAADASANLVLSSGSLGALAFIQVQDEGGSFITIDHLNGQNPLKRVQGPGVFRVKRPGGVNFAVDSVGTTEITAPVNTVAPAITGTTVTGNTLTCSQGTWTNAPARTTTYAYQWKRAGVAIAGETTNEHVLEVADEGQLITCDVTASNPVGDTTQASNGVTPTAV